MYIRLNHLLFIILSCNLSLNLNAAEWSGSISTEFTHFFHDGYSSQHGNNVLSFSAEPEFYHEWDDGYQSFTFTPFFRFNDKDDARNHVDIRELSWIIAAEEWELRSGIRKVFWGVTESVHLVDIINQTDLVENPDTEQKLGQPMINLALIKNWGTLDFFVLPYFRERLFPGEKGRFRSQPYVDDNKAGYQSSRKEYHIDWAIRWSHSIENWDIATSHFSGTAREPQLIPLLNPGGPVKLLPYYPLIEQTALELQLTEESWLWKLEAVSHRQQGNRHTAAVAGFEYTFYGINDSASDLGVLLEYQFDDRGTKAGSPFQNDIFTGFRFTLNDEQSTELLAGVILDQDYSSQLYSVEASRRFGDNWKLTLEGRFFSKIDVRDPLFSMSDDDYVRVDMSWYF